MVRAYTAAKNLRNQVFTRLVRRGFASFGAGSTIAVPAGIAAAGRISIGAGVVIGSGSALMVLDRTGSRVVIRLGDRVAIAGTCTISAVERVTIERDVLIARNVYISDHSHCYTDAGRPVRDQGIDSVAPVVIEAGAWLGQNVVITPGVTVGRGAVVAANAVVRSDVPAHSLAAGVPARIIKSWSPTNTSMKR